MTEAPLQQLTEYVILEADGDGWKEAGSRVARDATQAIKQHLDGKTEVDGRFVATPARSWKPVSVRSKVALDFGEPS